MKIEKISTGYDLLLTQREQPALKEVEELSSDKVTVSPVKNNFVQNPLGRSIPLNAKFYTTYNNINFNGENNGSVFLREIKTRTKEKLLDNPFNAFDIVQAEDERKELKPKYTTEDFLESYYAIKMSESARELRGQCNILGLNSLTKLNYMTLPKRKQYLSLLLTQKATFMSNEFKSICSGPLIPVNNAEYQKLLQVLRGKGPTDKDIDPKSLRPAFLGGVGKDDMKLIYETSDFINDVKKLTANLPVSERKKVMNCFGFRIASSSNGAVMMGSPSMANFTKNYLSIKDPVTKAVILKVKKCVAHLNECEPSTFENRAIDAENMNAYKRIYPLIPRLCEMYDVEHIEIAPATFDEIAQMIKDPDFENLKSETQDERILEFLAQSVIADWKMAQVEREKDF